MVARLTSIVIRYQKVAVSSTVTLILFAVSACLCRRKYLTQRRRKTQLFLRAQSQHISCRLVYCPPQAPIRSQVPLPRCIFNGGRGREEHRNTGCMMGSYQGATSTAISMEITRIAFMECSRYR